MKVCVIGDIHGTNKFIECYKEILEKDNDCGKIIVLGDHFDPYEDISTDEMVEKYQKFLEIWSKDERVVSILGNHDLATYVIYNDSTNRTARGWDAEIISIQISKNLANSYLSYKIGDYLFSHAGVSSIWMEDIGEEYSSRILANYTGWTPDELTKIVSFYPYDYSCYGNNVHQGCTWIRPSALEEYPLEGYNQVVGHTQIDEIRSIDIDDGKKIYFVDNMRKSKYLVLNIEENE